MIQTLIDFVVFSAINELNFPEKFRPSNVG